VGLICLEDCDCPYFGFRVVGVTASRFRDLSNTKSLQPVPVIREPSWGLSRASI
jgi:hypothetical protein